MAKQVGKEEKKYISAGLGQLLHILTLSMPVKTADDI